VLYSLRPRIHGALVLHAQTLAINLTNNTLEKHHKNYIIVNFIRIRIQWYNFLHYIINFLLTKRVVKVKSRKACAPCSWASVQEAFIISWKKTIIINDLYWAWTVRRCFLASQLLRSNSKILSDRPVILPVQLVLFASQWKWSGQYVRNRKNI
jgi:hypothetical protein